MQNTSRWLLLDRHLYLDFEKNEREEVNSACYFVSGVLFEDNSSDSEIAQEIGDNRAELKDNRLAAGKICEEKCD